MRNYLSISILMILIWNAFRLKALILRTDMVDIKKMLDNPFFIAIGYKKHVNIFDALILCYGTMGHKSYMTDKVQPNIIIKL